MLSEVRKLKSRRCQVLGSAPNKMQDWLRMALWEEMWPVVGPAELWGMIRIRSQRHPRLEGKQRQPPSMRLKTGRVPLTEKETGAMGLQGRKMKILALASMPSQRLA